MSIRITEDDDRALSWGPIGLSTLAVNIGEERETVEDMYEPYLIQKGFIKRTRTGAQWRHR